MKDFQALLSEAAALTHRPRQKVQSWKWAESNIDYSRVPNYDTPFLSRFDSARMPFWNQILDDLRDPAVREVAVLKCSRAGYSENVVLTDFRFTVCEEPEHTFYISGSEDLTKGFQDRRIIRGMGLSDDLQKKFKKAQSIKEDIRFEEMDFRCTWFANKTATKQDGFGRIYVDEIDLFPEGTIDAIRRRCSAYALHHIVWGGSIDFERRGNPEEAPILKLYAESDQAIWIMPDPAGGEFEWNLDGIKWPEGCKTDEGWDLERVASEAYYQTPNGTIITETERMKYTRAGRWQTRRSGIRKGYKITAPMIPFADASFGELAKKFLSAKNRLNTTANRHQKARNTLRTYFAEYWSQSHREEEMETTEDALSQCADDYKIGEAHIPKGDGWISGTYCACDIQKHYIYWMAVVVSFHKDSERVVMALLDFGTSPSFDDLDETLATLKPSMVGIDNGYQLRSSEVADYCAKYTDPISPKDSAVIALRGSDSLKATTMAYQVRDALEGRSGGSAPFLELTWATDVYRTIMMEEVAKGENFKIPKEWGSEKKKAMFMRQMTSTRKVDGEFVRNHPDDHLWDCLAEIFVLCRWGDLI